MRVYFILLAVAALVLCGCVAVHIDVSTKVSKDAIDEYKINFTMNKLAYLFLLGEAKNKGYPSVREYFLSKIDPSLKVTYDEEWGENSVSVIITIYDFIPSENSKVMLLKRDNYLIFSDHSFYDPKFVIEINQVVSGFSLDYYLEMPGKIIDSNANVVKENTATWHLYGKDVFTTVIYAKSEIPQTPGFSIIYTVAAMVLAVLLYVFKP
jgi:hypothetical protein